MSRKQPFFSEVIVRKQHDDGTYPPGFWDWIAANGPIYDAAVAVAREGRRIGHARWSLQGVLEILRWETSVRESAGGPLKINHNMRSGLARLIMAREPDLSGFFETRTPPARRAAFRLDGSSYAEARA